MPVENLVKSHRVYLTALVNLLGTRKREHSRKPDEFYSIVEACSRGPYLELFARGTRPNWAVWGNQADDTYTPTWKTYSNHSQSEALRRGEEPQRARRKKVA